MEFPLKARSDLALIHFFRSKPPRSSSEVCSTETRAEASWALAALNLLNASLPSQSERSEVAPWQKTLHEAKFWDPGSPAGLTAACENMTAWWATTFFCCCCCFGALQETKESVGMNSSCMKTSHHLVYFTEQEMFHKIRCREATFSFRDVT